MSARLEDGESIQNELGSYLKGIDVINELIKEASSLGPEYLHSLETLLSRVNNNNGGLFKGYLSTLQQMVDTKQNSPDVMIETFNNNGTYNSI